MSAGRDKHGSPGPRFHVIAVGDELLRGERTETNSREIQALLLAKGVRVSRVVVVGDEEREIAREVKASAARAEGVIVTGGLGPTEDDVTRSAVAAASGRPLREDPRALADLERFFRRLGREMKPSNRRQALVPEGAEVLPNPVGTAPAFRVPVEGTPVFCLPGVPQEMRLLMREAVLPFVERLPGAGARPAFAAIRLIGPTESTMNDRMEDLLAAGDPRVGITVRHSVITVTLTSDGPGAAERVERARAALLERFGDRVFSPDGTEELEEAVGRLLMERGVTTAVAESCTGGLVSHLLTRVPGISAVFLEGAVTYSGEAKERRLGVPRELLERHGQVSRPAAEAMALGVARGAGARAGLGVTGIAGPGGGTAGKPVGLVHMAAVVDGTLRSAEYRFSGDRDMVQQRAARYALDLLRRTVLGLAPASPASPPR